VEDVQRPVANGEGHVVLGMTIGHVDGRTIRPKWVLESLGKFGLDFDPEEAITDRRKILFG